MVYAGIHGLKLPLGFRGLLSLRIACLFPLLLVLSLALPSAAQGYATIYEHPAGIGPTSVIGSSSVTIRFSDRVATDYRQEVDQ